MQRSERGSPPWRDAGWRAWAGLLALVVLFAAWVASGAGDTALRALLSDLTLPAIGFVGGGLAWRAARQTQHAVDVHRAWRLIGLALFAYASGDLAWAVIELALEGDPFPSIADLGYVAFYPLVLAGLLAFRRTFRSSVERQSFWLAAATVVLGAGSAIWFFVFVPVLKREHAGLGEAAAALAYPLGDLVLLLGIATVLLRRTHPAARLPLRVLAAGLSVMVATDIAFGPAALQSSYEGGGAIDLGWAVAGLLLALAGQLQAWNAPMLATEATPHEGCVADLSPLPYAAVALGQALVVVSVIWNWDGALVGILVSSVLVTALVVVRQFILARERTRLLEAAAARRDALLQLARQFGARGIDPRLEQDAVQAARGLVGGEWVRFLRWEEQPTEQSAPPHGVGTSMAGVESELSAAGLEASRSGKAVARLRTPSLDSQGARDSILPLAVVAAPIGADGCTFGALTLARSGRDAAYTDADVQILSLLAGVIGGVLLGGSRARLEGALLAARTAEHELNNQLTGAAGFAELIVADDAASEQLREYARDILASSLEAARLVNEIRNLRRIALRGGAVPDATVIDVGNSAA